MCAECEAARARREAAETLRMTCQRLVAGGVGLALVAAAPHPAKAPPDMADLLKKID